MRSGTAVKSFALFYEYKFNNMNGHRHSNNLTTRYYWKVQKKKITPQLVIMVNFVCLYL